MTFTIDMQETINRTEIDNTRNDRYLILNTKGNDGCIVSYTNHLICKLQELNNSDSCKKNIISTNDDLRKLIAELENKNYLVFQLTRL